MDVSVEEGEATVNGDAGSESGGEGDKPKKCDIIIITGKKENCEAAKQALLVSTLHYRQPPLSYTDIQCRILTSGPPPHSSDTI